MTASIQRLYTDLPDLRPTYELCKIEMALSAPRTLGERPVSVVGSAEWSK
jgi:hypothetical protein